MTSSSRRLELFFWAVLPCLITVLLVIVFLVPKHLPGMNRFMPLLPLIPVFYWGMLHAREMPYWFVFALGLVMDSATGSPLGLSSLLYVFFLAMLHAQRKYVHKEGFAVKWVYFGLLLLLIVAINWLIVSLMHGYAHALGPTLLQWFLTSCFYPVFHKLFDTISQRAADRRWRILHGS